MNAYRIGEEIFQVELKKSKEGCAFHVNGREVFAGVSCERVAGGELAVRVGNAVVRAYAHKEGGEFFCHVAGA